MPWNLLIGFICLFIGPPQVCLPKMTYAKNILITWCPETWGANSRLFSTWWMSSPLGSLNCICSCLREIKYSPCPFSALYSLGNYYSMCKHSHTHTRTQLCGNRSRLQSTTEKADHRDRFQYRSGLLQIIWGEPGAPGQRFFFFFIIFFFSRQDAQSYCNKAL